MTNDDLLNMEFFVEEEGKGLTWERALEWAIYFSQTYKQKFKVSKSKRGTTWTVDIIP